MLNDVSPDAKVEAAALLRARSNWMRSEGRLPPPSWEQVADALELDAALSKLGHSDSADDRIDETLVPVMVVCRALPGTSSRSIRRQIERGLIPGALREDPDNDKSRWRIPYRWVAEQQRKFDAQRNSL